jgi:hypothetical protein
MADKNIEIPGRNLGKQNILGFYVAFDNLPEDNLTRNNI